MFMCMCGGLPQNWVAATARAPAVKAAARVEAPVSESEVVVPVPSAHPSNFILTKYVASSLTQPELPSTLA